MGVSPDHLEGFVSQDLGNLREAGTVHRKVGSGRMTEIVKAKAGNTSFLQGLQPGEAKVHGLLGVFSLGGIGSCEGI